MKNLLKIFLLSLAVMSKVSYADWSTTFSGVSDYTFNGVSQTMNNPALQVSLDKALDNGVYAGSWASNVDFGDDTNLEWDFYLGQYISISDTLSLDYGIAYYTYHGGDYSDEGNYPEAYAKLGYSSDIGVTELNFWYSWDYFGTGGGHTIAMLAHSYEVAPNHTLSATFDVSNSLDSSKWVWHDDNTSYYHYRLAYQTTYEGINLEVAAENTNLDWDTADERIVLSISKTFSL